jgi:3',5'-nucleoside bisphosphate phosphatase
VSAGGADLHLHSRHSDGSDDPASLVEEAAKGGLQVISLTDHDTIDGIPEAQEAGLRLGVRVIAGVELSAEFLGHEVHLLVYGFNPASADLINAMARSRHEREQRAERMVQRLNQSGIPITMEKVRRTAGNASLGRPHLAEALLRARVVGTIQEAFDRYLNPGRPAFVAREHLSLQSAKSTVQQAAGVLVLAHPHLNLSSANIRALVDAGIDGLETSHPRLKSSQSRELASLAQEKGILATGGSDFHGARRGPVRIGSVRISVEVADRIEQMAARRAEDREAKKASRVGGEKP